MLGSVSLYGYFFTFFGWLVFHYMSTLMTSQWTFVFFVFVFFLFWTIMNKVTMKCHICLFVDLCLHCLWVDNLREFFLSYMVIVCFTLYKLASYFLKWLYHSAFPPAIYESYKSILLGAMVESCTESAHCVAHDTSAHITVKRVSHVSRALVNKMGIILFSQQWKVPKEMD